MIQHRQLFRHQPDKDIAGDCWRTAIACLLDLSPEDVPHAHTFTQEDWNGHPIKDWLRERGLVIVNAQYLGETPLTDILRQSAEVYPGLNFMVSGRSPNANHVVIVRDGEIVWDPHPDEPGLVGPDDAGLWTLSFIAKRT